MVVKLNWLGMGQPKGTTQPRSTSQLVGCMAILSGQAATSCGVCGTTYGSTGWTLILGSSLNFSAKRSSHN
jgi:hypothetical protein